MLLNLHVKNLALIEETEVEFGEGLNILTGETGAGKSILLDSVNLALGAKAEADIIRNGADSALVELTFDMSGEGIRSKLEEMDLPVEDVITISRKISPGRSVSKVNGESVSQRQVKELSELLLDIHGQHEHQSLLQKKKHLAILDAFMGKEAEELCGKVEKAYEEWKGLLREVEEGRMDDAKRARELDLLTYEYDEIMAANLKIGEDEELEKRYTLLTNARKISEALNGAYALCGNEGDGAAPLISRALKELGSVSGYEEGLQNFYSQLLDIEALLEEFNRGVSDYMQDMECDGQDLAEVEERLNCLNHLKDKYGSSLEKVLAYCDALEGKIERMQNHDSYMAGLEKKCKDSQEVLMQYCENLSALRRKESLEFAKLLKEALVELNFLSVEFAVSINEKEVGRDGMDDVEFMISTNPGQALKSISQVASGGELSRIMLALKTMMAEKDAIDTLIFDEIDAGISGKTAWRVSEKLGSLAKVHQVICITHLPQIAAMSDMHFEIEKSTDGSSTRTRLHVLDADGSVKELARLLGADDLSEFALQNAMEMKNKAGNIKQSMV